MEGAPPQNASRNRSKPRGGGGRRRKYPALKDQKICVLELPPLIEENQALGLSHAQKIPALSRAQTVHQIIEDQALSPIRVQTVPGSSRAQKRGPKPAQTVPGPSRAVTIGPSHPHTVYGSSSPNTTPGPSHANTSSDQSTGSVIGQEVEGVIDGTFQDGYLISIKIGDITMKGVAYGSVTNEPGLAPEGQTFQQQINDLEESPRHEERHISSQVAAQTVRRVQPWSGGGTSSNPTKHQDKDQPQDVRGRGKEKV